MTNSVNKLGSLYETVQEIFPISKRHTERVTVELSKVIKATNLINITRRNRDFVLNRLLVELVNSWHSDGVFTFKFNKDYNILDEFKSTSDIIVDVEVNSVTYLKDKYKVSIDETPEGSFLMVMDVPTNGIHSHIALVNMNNLHSTYLTHGTNVVDVNEKLVELLKELQS